MASMEDGDGISQQAINIFTWIVYSVLCQLINIFGIVTNIINIICFVKQGFKDTVNITLLVLSVSDLGSLTTMVWTNICLTPAVVTANLPFEPVEVVYLTSVVWHLTFTRISSCITAMISLERCLCIIAPLKIHIIISPGRSATFTICVFIILMCTTLPIYTVCKLGMKYSPFRNKTLVGIIFSNNRVQVEGVFLAINNFALPIVFFAIIVFCTILLSLKLWKITKWRRSTVRNGQIDKVSDRNLKTAKMVVMISTLFIICFIPVCCALLAISIIPEMSLYGKYFELTVIIVGLGYELEGINSSANIFIYYHVSSNFRNNFLKIFYKNRCLEQH